MSYLSGDRVLLDSERESRISHFRTWVLVLIPLLAILFQLYVPLYVKFLQYLDIPLLVTIYFAMMRRSQLGGLAIGMLLGLAQDSLSRNPIGMFGICRTIVGYLAASIALKIDVDHPLIRLLVTFAFYQFDRFLLWVLERALLQLPVIFDLREALLLGFLNAVVGVALYHFLDRLKERQ
ncbi:MAG: rod shape-determining protein MreD [Acidobacteriota bacterium]|nr:rod shape-determining protein MreD [Acidobacteriota bacterium]